MSLFELLHKLIDHAVPQGNERGELHAHVDAMRPGPDEEPTVAAEPETPAAPPAKFATPKVNGPAGA
jgi:hypothetical protein